MHRNEENHRLRWLISMALAGGRQVALWSLRGQHTDFGLPDSIGLPPGELAKAQNQDVRLKPLTRGKPSACCSMATRLQMQVSGGSSLPQADPRPACRNFDGPDCHRPSASFAHKGLTIRALRRDDRN